MSSSEHSMKHNGRTHRPAIVFGSALAAVCLVATFTALGVFILEVLTLRWVSLGSILAALAFGGMMVGCHLAFGWYNPAAAAIGAGLSLLLVTRHHSNIRNLLRGTESKLWGEGSGRSRDEKP